MFALDEDLRHPSTPSLSAVPVRKRQERNMDHRSKARRDSLVSTWRQSASARRPPPGGPGACLRCDLGTDRFASLNELDQGRSDLPPGIRPSC